MISDVNTENKVSDINKALKEESFKGVLESGPLIYILEFLQNASMSLVCKKWKNFNDIVKKAQLKIVKKYLLTYKIDEEKIENIFKKCYVNMIDLSKEKLRIKNIKTYGKYSFSAEKIQDVVVILSTFRLL